MSLTLFFCQTESQAPVPQPTSTTDFGEIKFKINGTISSADCSDLFDISLKYSAV